MKPWTKIFLTGLVLIPGLAHIHRYRCAKGMILFLLFAFFANAFLVAPWILPANRIGTVRAVSAILAGAVWCYALFDLRNTADE